MSSAVDSPVKAQIPGEYIYNALAQGALTEFLVKANSAILQQVTGLPTPPEFLRGLGVHINGQINNTLMSYTPYEEKRESNQSIGLLSFWMDSVVDALRVDYGLEISPDGSRYWWAGDGVQLAMPGVLK